MPLVPFDALPSPARVWVFGAASSLNAESRATLIQAVDAYLATWKAHGMPLVCARDLRENRFLAIGVDEAATGASGCSIDGVFRVLAAMQETLGTSLVGGARLFWRSPDGAVESGTRTEFVNAAAAQSITGETRVFDLTVATAGDWRTHFEQPASQTWHARLLAGQATGHSTPAQ